MNWRDIPMPPRIARLPRTGGGLPVPHVAAWSSEHTDRIDRDPYLAALGFTEPASFSAAQGGGHPVLGQMDPARQRRAVVDRRCQVCDVELGERHRANPPWRQPPLWLADIRVYGVDDEGAVGHDLGGQTIRIGRRVVPLVFEPWVCEDCLAYALQVCPGLIKRRAGAADRRLPLRLLRVRNAQPVVVRGRVGGFGPLTGQTAATYVKLAVLDADIVLPDEFLRDRLAVAA